MSRGYWIAAIALGLTFLLPPEYAWAQEEQRSNTQEIEIPLPPFGLADQSNEPDRTTEPCKEGEDNRYSDLCAQWKAADAAKESADWTRRSFWLGFVGALTGVFTLGAAIAAAHYAKLAAAAAASAVDQGKDATEAARKSVKETTRIGEAQTRAYLSCVGARYDVVGQLCGLKVRVKNFGQSPAKHAVLSAHLMTPDFESSAEGATLETTARTASLYDIPASSHGTAFIPLQMEFPADVCRELVEYERVFLIHGQLTWNDVFGKPQHISFFLTPKDSSISTAPNGALKRSGKMTASNTRN